VSALTVSSSNGAAGREPGRPVPAAGTSLGLVTTIDAATFAQTYWSKQPLLSPAAAFPGAHLFDAGAVDELVSRRGLRTPFLRMAKDGSVIPPARYTRGGGAGATAPDQVADDKVLALLGDGATLVLQALHRTWPPLIEFASRLSCELGHPVQINAYVTPPQNQGFASHYDVHDVFVLQIAGHKQWRIHAPVFPAPLREHEWEHRRAAVALRATEPPLIDTELAPGDALYLPRGFLHSASALGETSIHLTVGVHPITRNQLVQQLVKAAKDEPALRESLPMGVDLSDPAVLAPILAATAQALHRSIDSTRTEDVAASIAADLADRTRPAPLGPLASLDAAAELSSTTRVRLRQGLRVRLVRAQDELRLRLVDRVLVLPVAGDAALNTMLSGHVLTAADLPGLDAEEQLVLVRRLLREGVLVPFDG
jgi:bifunctional lysine-specific demethylase and histidyl-hydroxylase NO66